MSRLTASLLRWVSVSLLGLFAAASADTDGTSVVKIIVTEGDDVMLPCSMTTKDLRGKLFDWKKGDQEVFLYDGSPHYGSGREGQDPQYKGRVSHFEDQLQYGNASILIRNTQIDDSGNYTCEFPHLLPGKEFYIELVVDPILKDRSDENIPGAVKDPYVGILDVTDDGVVLQCVVRDAHPRPELQWQAADGSVVPAQEPQVSERGGRYDVTLLATVTRSAGNSFRCEVKQEGFHHVIHGDITVPEKLFASSAAPPPEIRILNVTDGRVLLQCVVRDAHPQPELQWQAADGSVVPAQEPQVSERGDVTLLATVTRSAGNSFRCEVKQEGLYHVIHGDITVPEKLFASSPGAGFIFGVSFSGVLIGAVVVVVLILLAWCIRKRRKSGPAVVNMVVNEGNDAILSCSLGTRSIKQELFHWKKDDHQVVFMYNKDRTDQGQHFKGRVFHRLESGNASIEIRNTKVTDSGIYTCHFPLHEPNRRSHIELVVDPGEKENSSASSGATTCLTQLDKETDTGSALNRGKTPDDPGEKENSPAPEETLPLTHSASPSGDKIV